MAKIKLLKTNKGTKYLANFHLQKTFINLILITLENKFAF